MQDLLVSSSMICSLLALLIMLSRLCARKEGGRQGGWKAIAITDIETSKSSSGAFSVVFLSNRIAVELHATHF